MLRVIWGPLPLIWITFLFLLGILISAHHRNRNYLLSFYALKTPYLSDALKPKLSKTLIDHF